ncbi:MAG: serine hydrolase, partial [Propionicimonas sp.]
MDSPAAGRLRAAWDHELRGLQGSFSIDLRSLDGPVVSRDPATVHYAASTIKLAVLGALLRECSAGTPVGLGTRVQPRFPSAAGGSFALAQGDDQDDETWARLGQEVALTTLAERMIVASGNLATNLILERIGLDTVQAYLAGLGLAGQLRVGRLIGDTAAEALGITNTVTASGLASLMLGFARATA